MELKEAIFGHHNLAIWLGTMFWTILILFVYKINKAPRIGKGFKLHYFLNDNLYDFILNIGLASVMLRSGDGLIQSVYKFVNEKLLVGFDFQLNSDGMDVVIMVSIIVMPLSYVIHKFRNPVSKKLEKSMHIHNEICKK
jgi:hypothetical protein